MNGQQNKLVWLSGAKAGLQCVTSAPKICCFLVCRRNEFCCRATILNRVSHWCSVLTLVLLEVSSVPAAIDMRDSHKLQPTGFSKVPRIKMASRIEFALARL